jgi:hypothetical protein
LYSAGTSKTLRQDFCAKIWWMLIKCSHQVGKRWKNTTYPLVNCYITMENHIKSPFSIAMCVHQRVTCQTMLSFSSNLELQLQT